MSADRGDGGRDGDATAELAATVATACRVLGRRGLVDGVLGHVSARLPGGGYLVRCRGPHERGVARTAAEDVRRVGADDRLAEPAAGWQLPKELPIHAALYRARPEVGAVVHAHPPAALRCGLAGLEPRPVFGAYNIPALRMAVDGVPVYPRPVLISRPELAEEMVAAMGDRPLCLLRGHGITVTGPTVEAATVAAVNLEDLLSVTLDLALLGVEPPALGPDDLAELPDLGTAFNDELAWRALVAELRDVAGS